MTLPASGAINLQQVANELAVVGPFTIDRTDARWLANVLTGPINMTNFYGDSCETYSVNIVTPGSSWYGCDQSWPYGSLSPGTLRGVPLTQLSVNTASGIFQLGINSSQAQSFFRAVMLRPDASTTSMPNLLLPSAAATLGAGSGVVPQYWRWTGVPIPNWASYVGQNVRVQVLY